MTKSVILLTERAILRPWLEKDIKPFVEMSLLPEVMEYLPPFKNEETYINFARKLWSDLEKNGFGFWVAVDRQSGDFAGIAGIHKPGPEFGVGFPCTEIGWRLHPQFWGRGLATEAAKEIMRFAFQELKLKNLVSFAARENIKSIMVMKRLGMKKACEFELLLFPGGHKYRAHYLYEIANQDFSV